MKTSYLFLKLLVPAIFLLITSCSEKEPDPVEKTLNISEGSLKFTYEGTSRDVEVTSNTEWTVEFEEQSVDWVSFSPESGEGNGIIRIEVLKNEEEAARVVKLTVSCEGITRTITIEQARKDKEPEPDEKIILFENAGETPANSEISDFSDWLKSGTGAANVSYTGVNTQVRNAMSSSSYEKASGVNNIFFYTFPQEFIINDIDITGETNFTFSFGISDAVSSSSYGSVTSSTIKLAASLDGITYTSLEYTNSSDNSWVVASTEFIVPEGSTSLFIKLYDAYASGTVRADDFKLIAGGNGSTLITPSPQVQWGAPSCDFELGYEGITVPVTITIPYTDGIGQTIEFSVSDNAGSVYTDSRPIQFGDDDVILSFDYTPDGMGSNGFDVKVDGTSIGQTTHNVYGVVYYENFNATTNHTYNPASTQYHNISEYTDYLKQNQPGVTYESVQMSTGTLKMITWMSAILSKEINGKENYENASGSYHVLLGGSANVYHQLIIKGLDTSIAPGNTYMTVGVYYMMGQAVDLTPALLGIEYSTDGVSWTELEFNALKNGAYWRIVKITDNIPSSQNLMIRFTPKAMNLRLDDIRIWGY